jgi:2-hydroxyacyl-CoA lyase
MRLLVASRSNTSDIAAQLVYPAKRVVAVVGDSAFGFRYYTGRHVNSRSAMEIETAARSALPILVFVINNNGIYFGLDAAEYTKTRPLPSTALTPDTRYDLIAEVMDLINHC